MSPEHIGVLIPFVIFLIPIIAILTSHQRKMAEIIHGNQNVPQGNVVGEIQALRYELAQMRDLMHQQSLAIDDLKRSLPASTMPPIPSDQHLTG